MARARPAAGTVPPPPHIGGMRLVRDRDRAATLGIVLALHLAAGWLLLAGRTAATVPAQGAAIRLFDLPPPDDPPPAVRPHPVPSRAAEGAAAPVNRRATATPLVAPEPPVPRPPPPIPAAPVPNVGFDPAQGAGDRPGPGTGAGGDGDGFGSGRFGDGTGSGGAETPPRWRRGRIGDRDYPRGLGEAGVTGAVAVRYLVGTDGRVADCAVERSSGSALLDDTTCGLIVRRFRFDPSRDEAGRPVPAWIVETHHWLIEDDPSG